MNHVIDPTYFYDAIAQFGFTYDIFHTKGLVIDDEGKQSYEYEEDSIYGSLQSQGHKRNQRKKNLIDTWEYEFYCKSLDRIDIGDIIVYRSKYLYVDSVTDYDEWGVRQAHLQMVELSACKDFSDWLKYHKGEKAI